MRSQSILYDDSAPKPEFLSRKHEWRIISIASSTYESSDDRIRRLRNRFADYRGSFVGPERRYSSDPLSGPGVLSNHLFASGPTWAGAMFGPANCGVPGSAPNIRFAGIMLPGNGEAHPDTPEGNTPEREAKAEETPTKANGVGPGVPSKFPNCASEMTGASLIASFSRLSFAF